MKKLLGKLILLASGWRFEGAVPAAPKFVLIAAPHTSNWDLVLLLALAAVVGVRISWMGKYNMFVGPFGWMLKRFGGIPIYRHQRLNMVDQMVERFAESERLVLVVPAEATRGRGEYWKSGFYHIARRAGVPIYTGYLDYRRRRGSFGEPIMPTGDVRADMDKIRAFYADKVAKYPEKFTPPRLREEDEAIEASA
ncbi:MAG: acyltransferase [Deltaproteobacteria bacterium]|nr:MAG: acyltransferase [Deltaproteobacteria bacterium]